MLVGSVSPLGRPVPPPCTVRSEQSDGTDRLLESLGLWSFFPFPGSVSGRGSSRPINRGSSFRICLCRTSVGSGEIRGRSFGGVESLRFNPQNPQRAGSVGSDDVGETGVSSNHYSMTPSDRRRLRKKVLVPFSVGVSRNCFPPKPPFTSPEDCPGYPLPGPGEW